MRIAVTGALGNVGGQVVRLLAEQGGAEVVALSRRPAALPSTVIARTADYGQLDSLRSSLADVETLVFVSSDGEATRVLAHHLNVVSAARDCGVRHIVALSGVDADTDSPFCYAVTNGFTEQAIRDSGCGYSIVRASIFAEFFRHFLAPARSTGQIRLPAGDGRVGLVSQGRRRPLLGALARSAPDRPLPRSHRKPGAGPGRRRVDRRAGWDGRWSTSRSRLPSTSSSWRRRRTPGGCTPTPACSPRTRASLGAGHAEVQRLTGQAPLSLTDVLHETTQIQS
jgi:NAD(P)H dehydrogenase (quinone)